MKREIKFRGSTIENSKWVYGCLDYSMKAGPFAKHIDYAEIITEDEQRHSVWPATIGQFTGLVDGKGVDMYEGDEFTTVWKSKENTTQNGTVFWNVARGRWDAENATFPSRSRKTTTVTGNIHEQ